MAPRALPPRRQFAVTRLVVLGLGLLAPAVCFGQALDGPRAWLPFEEGPNDVAGAYVHRFGDISPSGTLVKPGTSYETDLVVASYARSFPMSSLFFGLAGISAPVGITNATGTVFGEQQASKSSGLGDLELSFAAGMQPQRDLAAGPWSPAFTLLAQLAVTAPTGAYESDQLANLGDNRFGIRTSMPFTLSFGAVGKQTTFELVPAMTIFTDNNHPLEGETMSQSALGRLETHATQDVFEWLWIAADAVYLLGGETWIDGLGQGNQLNTFSLGGTVVLQPLRFLRFEGSYAHHFFHATDGGQGGALRLRATAEF